MSQPIFKWSGEYVGFISNDYLFDAESNYLGWIEEDGRVWRDDGEFLGNLTDDNYILRSESHVTPIPRIPRVPPIPPVPPVPCVDRVGRIDRIGWEDAVFWS